MPLILPLIPNMSWSHCLKYLIMREVTFFSFFSLSVFSSLLSLYSPQGFELEDVVFFPWLLLFGEGFEYFALPTTFSAGSSSKSPALPFSFRPVSLPEFAAGGIKFCWCWFLLKICSESLFELFCDIVETLLNLSWDMNFLRILTTRAQPFTSRVKQKEDGGLSQTWKTQY